MPVLRCIVLSLGFQFALIGSISHPVLASESDVHYGLTYWLAIKAGFSPQHAEIIASANQDVDEGKYTPATWVVSLHIILDGDVNAAEFVRDTHFPSFTRLPAEALSRKVTPNSVAARHLAHSSIEADPRVPIEYGLEHFGEALHPLQDSWSHQGIPDIPFRPGYKVRPLLSFAHPENRGGWYSHDADRTCLHVEDTVASGKATYEMLTAYLNRRRVLGRPSGIGWPALEPDVRRFAEACTKDAKLKWFKSSGVRFSDYAFLNGISAPGVLSAATEALKRGRAISKASWLKTINSSIPESIRKFVDGFLTTWIVKGQVAAATEFVDTEAIERQLSTFASPNAVGETDARLWTTRFLTLWLVRDHGLINQLGHGMPIEKGYSGLPSKTSELSERFSRWEYKSLSEALTPVTPMLGMPQQSPYILAELDQNPKEKGIKAEYVVVFRFKKLPYDTLLLTVSPRGNDWRISSMLWLAM